MSIVPLKGFDQVQIDFMMGIMHPKINDSEASRKELNCKTLQHPKRISGCAAISTVPV